MFIGDAATGDVTSVVMNVTSNFVVTSEFSVGQPQDVHAMAVDSEFVYFSTWSGKYELPLYSYYKNCTIAHVMAQIVLRQKCIF